MDIRNELLKAAREGYIRAADLRKIAASAGLDPASAERAALEAEIIPERYRRNGATISVGQQRTLSNGAAVVVGCGGLGGYVVEELARLGVGRITAIDPDVFEEHNLNRQLFSDESVLGKPKVAAAAARIALVNPAVELVPVRERFTVDTAQRQLSGAAVAVDALDSVPSRRELAASCTKLGIPLVHGSIAGWFGQVAVQYPGESTLEALYAGFKGERGVEERLGNPAFTPAVVASLQAALACKIILGIESGLRRRVLMIDLLSMSFETIALG
ncbi:MAG TPA: HesA/MoeB/ThiF family protein [Spirochaetota bacterium]|nr:HesA/MoeB/ThiF family protein [Spirochaetota bacterium]